MESLESIDTPIQPRPAGCPVPLTATQRYMWNGMMKQGTRLSSKRLAATSVRILGSLDICLLRQSIQALVQRHESLRTRIDLVEDTPVQHVDTESELRLEVIDLTKERANCIDGEAAQLVQAFLHEKIDISAGPLFEGRLLRLSNREHVLVLGIDHIVSDAVSCEILSREIWSLYSQGEQGQPFMLPKLPVQFGDYAVWQQRTSDAWRKKHEAYWREHLADWPNTKMAPDCGLGDMKPSVATLHFPFGRALTARLLDLARSERSRLSSLVLAAYVAMVSRWLDQKDLVLGFFSHGRHFHPELENIIGFLSTHMYLRFNVTESGSFIDLMNRVSLELHSAYQHYDHGRVPHLISGIPALNFNWLTINWARSSIHKERTSNHLRIQSFPAKTVWPVTFQIFFSETSAGIIATVAYRTDLFAKSTIEHFCQTLRLFATEFSRRPFAPIGTVMVG